MGLFYHLSNKKTAKCR